MKFSLASILAVGLATQGVVASTWFGSAGAYCNGAFMHSCPLTLTDAPVYNKWHETELERWLSDHNVPYPKASDRKDLERLVNANWNDKVVYPYNSWDADTLQNYLTLKGHQAKEGTEQNTNSLIQQVKNYWTETEESANQAYGNVRDWIFDTYHHPTGC